jgi:hypothetical protein
MSRQKNSTSFLIVEEYFDSADESFLDNLKKFHDPKKLGPFSQRWASDSRPWARAKIFEYLNAGWAIIGHQAVIKRLFKTAEEKDDIELLAFFAVYFDRMIEHRIVNKWRWDWQSRSSWQVDVLVQTKKKLPLQKTTVVRWGGKSYEYATFVPKNAEYFSMRTRHYLQRRVWRYFRRMGFQKPDKYCQAVTGILEKYRDKDVAHGVSLLDRYSLMNICFRYCDALEFGARRVSLRTGHSLSELKPAPRFLKQWETNEGFDSLMHLLSAANSHLVRVWTCQMLREHHLDRIARLPVEQILRLLAVPDAEVRQLAVSALGGSDRVANLSIDVWLDLLKTDDPEVLETLSTIMRKHVSVDRLNLQQCVDLTCSEPTAVAQLGFDFCKQKSISTADDRQAISRIAHTRCFAVARSAAKWAIALLGSEKDYQRDNILPFFDSLSFPVREEAWNWLTTDGCVGYRDSTLFLRLLENPFSDIRLKLVDLLEKRAKLPGVDAEDLTPVWATVMLGIHHGGRQKLKATGQLAEAIEQQPKLAEQLMPILLTAANSIRGPESRSALVAITSLLNKHPQLQVMISEKLPSLEFVCVEASQ